MQSKPAICYFSLGHLHSFLHARVLSDGVGDLRCHITFLSYQHCMCGFFFCTFLLRSLDGSRLARVCDVLGGEINLDLCVASG
jgi:hypothetical protein